MSQDHLTPTEWSLMECLWENAPRTGREAVEYLAHSAGWSRSTTLTMLRRMTEKGLIALDEKRQRKKAETEGMTDTETETDEAEEEEPSE